MTLDELISNHILNNSTFNQGLVDLRQVAVPLTESGPPEYDRVDMAAFKNNVFRHLHESLKLHADPSNPSYRTKQNVLSLFLEYTRLRPVDAGDHLNYNLVLRSCGLAITADVHEIVVCYAQHPPPHHPVTDLLNKIVLQYFKYPKRWETEIFLPGNQYLHRKTPKKLRSLYGMLHYLYWDLPKLIVPGSIFDDLTEAHSL